MVHLPSLTAFISLIHITFHVSDTHKNDNDGCVHDDNIYCGKDDNLTKINIGEDDPERNMDNKYDDDDDKDYEFGAHCDYNDDDDNYDDDNDDTCIQMILTHVGDFP